ncbi:PREDICTED: thionin-like protein 2 [Tarenaya hassleriana]|uniref:thionin-like protein 2 n=1 Tax=Tarenaya hassleriana TaxID=28532 RepID=UPI00053C2A15|nr:PREDICTED: thionin-like protein 2 [Tarenaya hassleriana]
MESKRVMSAVVMMVVVVIGTSAIQTEAGQFGDCYKKCLLGCALEMKFKAYMCPLTCLKTCVSPGSPSLSSSDQTHYFCKLGCASSNCLDHSSVQNPNEEEVENCLNACSHSCIKN